MHGLRRAVTAMVVGGVVIAGSAGAAGADPKGMPVDLHCGDDHYSVVTAGNGAFTPAHDLASNTVFIPVVFGAFRGTLTNLDTDVVETFVDPMIVHKGNAHPRGRTPMECTYTFVDEFTATAEDEGLIPGDDYRFVGTGEVTGFASGRR